MKAAPGYVLDASLTKVEVAFNPQEVVNVIFENEKEKTLTPFTPDINTTKPNIPDFKSPETSDKSVMMYVVSAVTATVALVVLNRKKKNIK